MAFPGANGPLPRVQNFKVHKMLGKGSYGKVYKVQRERDNEYYALKETDLSSMSQVERGDAVNEIRLLVSINHPNVIRYHEAFLNGNKLCVVMEYAPFGDLRYYISKGQRLKAPFPEEAIWRIFLQLCRGLAELHHNQIVHRDIKPANIFLCANDLLKIGDLGIAKALTRMNFARTQIGTPCYMAPEVWSGKPYSFSSDYFSLGCVLYEMLTFRTAFEGRSMQELKVKICSGRFQPVAPGHYSSDLVNFCHALLSLDPKKRPTPDAIINSPAGSKWLRVLPSAPMPPPRRFSENGAPGAAGGKALLDTIVVPRDLRQLPRKLPPASYDSDASRPPAPPSDHSAPSSRAHSRAPSPAGSRPGAPALPPINAGIQRQNSANQLLPPALRPGLRRVSYS